MWQKHHFTNGSSQISCIWIYMYSTCIPVRINPLFLFYNASYFIWVGLGVVSSQIDGTEYWTLMSKKVLKRIKHHILMTNFVQTVSILLGIAFLEKESTCIHVHLYLYTLYMQHAPYQETWPLLEMLQNIANYL